MNRQQAFRIAIAALEFKRHNYCVDANLAEKVGADYPAALSAQKTVNELNQAITILQKEIEAQSFYPRQVQ